MWVIVMVVGFGVVVVNVGVGMRGGLGKVGDWECVCGKGLWKDWGEGCGCVGKWGKEGVLGLGWVWEKRKGKEGRKRSVYGKGG